MASSPIPLGRTILYLTVSLVVQTLFFGAYTVIIILSTRMLMRRGLKTLANKTLLAITNFMYLLSATYSNPQTLQTVSNPVTHLLNLFNALALLNYILCDGIIIWRARLICAPGHQFCRLPESASRRAHLSLTQLMLSSFLWSACPYGVVGITAWQHRQAIRDGFNKTSKGDQILRILLDSGVLYCIAEFFGLATVFIRLPYNMLGDLYTPVNFQIAGRTLR
ncbi:hypothetical protein B0H12DRAFT_62277 [Mycena haematopus]|nr:hypothetical protein B0H12DRAFT_62277 [Mycena haematopus]